MLRKDFILVQIEALGKAIAQLIHNRQEGDPHKDDQLLDKIYTSLTVDKNYLLTHTPEEIREVLNGEDNEGLQRMEMAAKTLIEDYYISDETAALCKAEELLRYIQEHDRTFSLERINLLEEIRDLLTN